MKSRSNLDPRRELLQIFSSALQAVDGRAVVSQWLRDQPPAALPNRVVAIGKAALSMALGAQDVLGTIASGLLITKHGHGDARLCHDPRWQCIESGHPYPDENSLRAGSELLAFIGAAGRQDKLLFLISGGTSALVEVLPEGMTLADLDELNRQLLSRALDINQINRVRQSLSCIKGGRLAAYLQGREALQLLISDVPGDAPHVIGSGLLVPAPPATPPSLSPPWDEFAERVPPPPSGGELNNIRTAVVANNLQARRAARQAAIERGWKIQVDAGMEGQTHAMARQMARMLREGKPGIYIWGGETHLELPPEPGQGGRNQSLALAVALEIQDCAGCWLLAAGTDGTDGPTDDAGALVDGRTVEAGAKLGLDAAQALRGADAGAFLEQTGELIHTGPTGTNVMDLCIALKLPG